MLKISVWLLKPNGDKAPPAARVKSTLLSSHRNGGHSCYLSSSLSLMVGFSIQDEAVDVARSALQGGHYHAGIAGVVVVTA